MSNGAVAVLGSVIAFVVVYILGRRSGKSSQKEELQETLSEVAQDAATAKSAASAEVAQAKVEVALAKSAESKAEAEKIQSDVKAELAKKLVMTVLHLSDKNEQNDEAMQELETELESARRSNNIEKAIEVTRKQAALAVERGMKEEE